MTRVEALDIPDTATGRAKLAYFTASIGSAARLRAVSDHPPAPRVVRIALAGCGVVGGALVRLLDEARGAIEARHGIRFEIAKILVRDLALERNLPVPTALFTDNLSELLAAECDVVVEAIGGDEIAGEIARAALGRGSRFITANKELIASTGCELAALARTSSTSLDFGAAVGGSAPVISLLRDLLGASSPECVRAILNGTSNFILTELERGKSFSSAVDAARTSGLAEADVSRDLDGRDAAAKLAIIAWISFGVRPSDLLVRRIGLNPDPSRLVRHAALLGRRIRYIAECSALDEGRLCASVEPVLVDETSSFARTRFEDNRVEVYLGWAAPLSVSGPGAGGAPTAVALLGDLVSSAAPRNERGTSRPAFRSVEDLRLHCWLVVAECSLSRLEEIFRQASVFVEDGVEKGDGAGIFASAAWPDVARVTHVLQARGIAYSVAREDDASSRRGGE